VRPTYPLADKLVSIVVPAFNAAATIRESIVSALNQTHRNTEVIVIDDGSADQTRDIVASLMRGDARIQYFHQANSGVAAARNLGIAKAQGDFVATLDADDLWYPTKLTRQLERFQSSGPETALVYAWCSWINEYSDVVGCAPPSQFEGNILPQMCLGNVIISCSNALIRRDALIAAGGFDETLRSRGGQGCEDWKLYLQIAERHQVAIVPEYLVGYRVSSGSMSDDFKQMMRSRRLVETEFISAYPELAAQFARGEAILARSLALRAIERGRYRSAIELLTNQSHGKLASGLASLVWLLGGSTRRLLRRMRKGTPSPTQFLPISHSSLGKSPEITVQDRYDSRTANLGN
jgi:glycosyltransferase involved in cell wall biosynthesis